MDLCSELYIDTMKTLNIIKKENVNDIKYIEKGLFKEHIPSNKNGNVLPKSLK